jgi:parvulin-like peptidyl-prolyl isomerase
MFRKSFLIIFAALFLASCQPYVAEVDGQKVKLSEYKRLKEQRAKQLKAQGVPVEPEELKTGVLNELIERKLIVAGAGEKGIKVTEGELDRRLNEIRAGRSESDFRKFLRENGFGKINAARESLAEDMLIEKFRFELAGINDVTVDMVRVQYEAEKPTVEPQRVEALLIEAKDEEKANSIYKKIKTSGVEKIKKELSAEKDVALMGPSAINPELFSKTISDALKEAGKGDIIPPVRGGASWYVIVVYGKKPPVYASFDDIKEQMMLRMIEAEREKRLSAWLSERRGRAKIRIRERLM